MIKAAIFDMDGLLIDSEPFWRQAEKTAFETVGLTLTKADFNSTMGTRVDEVVAYRFHQHPWEGASQKDIEALITDEVIKAIKRSGEPRAGVIRALDLCQEQTLSLAVASSSSTEIIDTVLDTLDIRHYFEFIHSAEHESHGKPHPAVFISTAELLKVPAHEILIFEDSPAGVLAAKAAKMRCIAVPEPEAKEHPFIQTADIIIDSLEQFDQEMLTKL